MPIPLVVKEVRRSTGHIMVTAPATQTNRDPNHDKTLTRSNQTRTSETYRRQDDVFGYELQFLLLYLLIECCQYLFHNLNYNMNYKLCIQRRLYDVLSIQQSHQQDSDTIKFYVKSSRRVTRRQDNLCDILQAMAPTNVETVHQNSLFHIESNLDRLGLLSPTHGKPSQQQSGQITLESVLINKPKFLKVTHPTGKLKYRGP